jgi:hypothetical protein
MELVWIVLLVLGAGCSASPPQVEPQGAVAVVYYWKAKEGKVEEYNRYIREVAEPIDAEGQRQGAFLSVTTFVSQKQEGPWTHMRVFILKDRSQLEGLSAVLDAAGVRLEPDETKRKARSEYAATLRDFVGQETLDILR